MKLDVAIPLMLAVGWATWMVTYAIMSGGTW